MVTDAMIEAGAAELWHTLQLSEEVIEDLRADGNLDAAARNAYAAMYAARPTADLGEDGELVERLRKHWTNFNDTSLLAEAADRLILYREALRRARRIIATETLLPDELAAIDAVLSKSESPSPPKESR